LRLINDNETIFRYYKYMKAGNNTYARLLNLFNKDGDNDYDDAFNVYMEKLYALVFKKRIDAAEFEVHYDIYRKTLKEWLKDDKPYNQDAFVKEVSRKLNSKKLEEYTIYLGIHLKRAANVTFPIGSTLKVGAVKIKLRSFKQIAKVANGKYLNSLIAEYTKERYTTEQATRMIIADYVFFQAKVEARQDFIAVKKVAMAFELIAASATMAQERFKKVSYFGSHMLSGRNPIIDPYVFYVGEEESEIATYTVIDSHIKLPDENLDFTKDKNQQNYYKKYLRIISNTEIRGIDLRIKDLLLEFKNAMGTSDPHIRALSLWRCLEVATRRANSTTRAQSEIVEILGTYYTNSHWKEMGLLIKDGRNSYVHQGEGLNSLNRDMNLRWLQDYVSCSLSILMWMRGKKIGIVDESEADYFFDMYPKPIKSYEIVLEMYKARK